MLATQGNGNGSNGHALIELRDVFKTYEAGGGDVTVLREVTLKVQPGEFVSVVGRRGRANPRC